MRVRLEDGELSASGGDFDLGQLGVFKLGDLAIDARNLPLRTQPLPNTVSVAADIANTGSGVPIDVAWVGIDSIAWGAQVCELVICL